MGEGKLSGCRAALIHAGLLAASLLAPLPAQGPVYRERWGYSFLELRRQEVLQALPGRDATVRQKVADLLAQPTLGAPFVAPARALALLRGVPADAAFVLRATIGVFPLPEVVDPDGDNEVCRQLNASVFLPFTVELPGAISCRLEVRDRAGAVRYTTTLDEDTDLAGLRMARPAAQIPAVELADGSYELRIEILIDQQPPRAQDPQLRLPFHVLRGYQRRAEAASQQVRDWLPRLPALPKALLEGLGNEVSRTYLGEAFDGRSTPVQDLERLERAIDNLQQQRHVLDGIHGEVATALPGKGGSLGCLLLLSAERNPAQRPPPRPLLVLAGACPAYDIDAARPTAPATRHPRWLLPAARSLAEQLDCDVACLESSGNGRDYAADLAAVLQSLRELWGGEEQPILLVADREAAAVVGLQLPRLHAQLQGLVLLGAGAMPAAVLELVGKLPVRLGPVVGLRASEGLRRVLDYAERAQQAGGGELDLQRLAGEEPAWVFALPGYLPAITNFAKEWARSVRR